MKMMRQATNKIFQWFSSPEDRVFKNGLFPTSTSLAFSQLTLQDKILILGKMINQLRLDDGFSLDSAEKMLLNLNRKLNQQIIRTWNETYSERSDS